MYAAWTWYRLCVVTPYQKTHASVEKVSQFKKKRPSVPRFEKKSKFLRGVKRGVWCFTLGGVAFSANFSIGDPSSDLLSTSWSIASQLLTRQTLAFSTFSSALIPRLRRAFESFSEGWSTDKLPLIRGYHAWLSSCWLLKSLFLTTFELKSLASGSWSIRI